LNAQPESREEFRSNVFLSAVLTTGDSDVNVLIRNLSSNGALLDAPRMPETGAVTLRRGCLRVDGKLAWAGGGECGVRFDEAVDVKAWVKRVIHPGQQRVDAIVNAVRSGAVPRRCGDALTEFGLGDVSEQLLQVTADLSKLPNMTTETAELVLRLDTISRGLRRLAARSKPGAIVRSVR